MSADDRHCPVCESDTTPFGSLVVIGRHRAEFERCESCGLVFVRSPHWLEEAYGSAISALDVGLLERAANCVRVTSGVIRAEGIRSGTFLDWAGGYGTLTRLARDRGLDFRHLDPKCENIFAQGHAGDLDRSYDMITAFEVLEHLVDPLGELTPLSACTDRILLSTWLVPTPPPRPNTGWWYYTPESGQHVTLFSEDALHALAERLGYSVLTNHRNLHLLYRGRPGFMTAGMLRDLPTRLRRRGQRLRHCGAPTVSTEQDMATAAERYSWSREER